ncbi:MAG: hypothetical protein IPK88_04015 [Saprospiraceae bacterium]|nr:hypothetical protein [Candidatus Defluviibacterium haderslevense]
MLTKEIINDQIKEMPDEFTIDELIESLLIVEKINQGLTELEQGKIITEDELDQRMAKLFG